MTLPRKRLTATVVRTVIAYLVSSFVHAIIFFEVGGGHADVPFTTFPDYLVVAPALPVLAIWDLREHVRTIEFLSLAAFVATFVAVWFGTGALLSARSRDPDRE
jgi:hypothetical protein